MAHGRLLKRQARRSPPLIFVTCVTIPHSVLALLSKRYPQLEGSLPMHYSPFRHSHPMCIATHRNLVRLACLIHAASVRSEPESNSPTIKFCRTFINERPTVFTFSTSLTGTSLLNRIASESVNSETGFSHFVFFKEPCVSSGREKLHSQTRPSVSHIHRSMSTPKKIFFRVADSIRYGAKI